MTRILLDSHALFWFIDGNSRPSQVARNAIAATESVACVGAVTVWEIASKFRLGKWPAAQALANDLAGIISAHGFEPLPLSLEHARHAGVLRSPHRDPFDRMLAALA
jgi:PIN domain nuclease of toxin-antitoxin system